MLPESIFDFIAVQLEGGDKVHDRGASDPGGLTKWGISKRANPDLDIANLTREDAMRVYTERYWKPTQCYEFNSPAVQLAVMDCAINQGVASAILLLQSAVGVKQDGKIGPLTIKAANAFSGKAFLRRFMRLRIARYLNLNNQVEEDNERGWMNRLVEVVIEAASRDASG